MPSLVQVDFELKIQPKTERAGDNPDILDRAHP